MATPRATGTMRLMAVPRFTLAAKASLCLAARSTLAESTWLALATSAMAKITVKVAKVFMILSVKEKKIFKTGVILDINHLID